MNRPYRTASYRNFVLATPNAMPLFDGATHMAYDPDRHHRRSIRLRNYDYSSAGVYFVTILVKDCVRSTLGQ